MPEARTEARANKSRSQNALDQERRRQLRGLILLALAALLFAIFRRGPAHIFTPSGWWRPW